MVIKTVTVKIELQIMCSSCGARPALEILIAEHRKETRVLAAACEKCHGFFEVGGALDPEIFG